MNCRTRTLENFEDKILLGEGGAPCLPRFHLATPSSAAILLETSVSISVYMIGWDCIDCMAILSFGDV